MATSLKCIKCGKEVKLKECLLHNAKKVDEQTCICQGCLSIDSLENKLNKNSNSTKQSPFLMGRIVAGIIGGFILAVLGANISTIIFNDPMAKEPSMTSKVLSLIFFFFLWAVSMIIAIKAKSTAKAWRKLLISNACLSFALPISFFIFIGSTMNKFADKGKDIEAAVTAGVGGVTVIFVGILGFFLGAIFLTIGLLACKDKANIEDGRNI